MLHISNYRFEKIKYGSSIVITWYRSMLQEGNSRLEMQNIKRLSSLENVMMLSVHWLASRL